MAGGRIGYAQDRFLFYVKSGAVFTNIISKYSSEKTEPTRTAYLKISGANNTTGYGVGGGIEYAIPFKVLSNVSVKMEYLYLGIDRTQSTYGDCTCDFLWTTMKNFSGIHTAKFGMNYKF
jgi:outer membrane immunogenic protein